MREERPPFSPVSKEQVIMDLPDSRVDDLTVETTFDVNGEVASSPVRKTDPKVFQNISFDFFCLSLVSSISSHS